MKTHHDSIISNAVSEEECGYPQLFLFSGTEIPKSDRSHPSDYTDERFFRGIPEVHKAVIELLAQPGITIRQICKVCHVDNTLRAVEEREQIPVATVTQKKRILRTIVHASRLCAERVQDSAAEIGLPTKNFPLKRLIAPRWDSVESPYLALKWQ
jgi:hypothetical protein